MKRVPLVVGNWKCHNTVAQAVALATEVRNAAGVLRGVEIALAPPFTALHAVAKRLEGSAVALAAQDCHWEDAGAFTGEISPIQLRDLGCHTVILGHSERRQLFGETDAIVQKKIQAAFRANLAPLLCVGETLAEREAGSTLARIEVQLAAALSEVTSEQFTRLVVAYEPVWAIGTGRNATPEQAEEVHHFIREELARRFGSAAESSRILYGGSVKPDNAASLLGQPNIDGALVGGASLVASSFLAIARAVPAARS